MKVQLNDILKGVEIQQIIGENQMLVSVLVFDSRKIEADCVFFAIKGTLVDGHDFIEQSISNGATVIVCENLPKEINANVTYIKVENAASVLGIMAANFYQNPSHKLKLVGITGTNGKTTIATLLFKLFRKLGYNVGLISTVENQINDQIIPSTHTTPNPLALNSLLNEMVNQGCTYCFMEVSSHSVVQQRISGLAFVGAVFSNITHDHLDFHETFDKYIKAKKGFFDMLPASAFALTNLDDKNGMVMLQNTKAVKKNYALKQLADYKASVIENNFNGLLLDIDGMEVFFKLIGSFNAYNLLAVYGSAILLNQDKMDVLTALSSLTGAEGRFDYITSAQNIIGVVDYAHTPDAVQNVLSTINDIKKGNEQIITIIGCGGDRDKTKRKVMAKVACEWSDKVILTSDNPRTENPQTIIEEMEEGVTPSNKRKTISILDRKEAIKTACHLAKPGDIILLAGKGHEKYQEINGVRNHFDDKEILLEQFKLMN
ncbi:MAG: UDP-N-acetylmuramoyl-L-alanyl-D-glutamate--2,6-diaminopimelate ligase [Sphingobacteriaceae bacterium]|nr:UDP-N-acetylmuramoyl-L-alanyl-D-glutamate--2,6-diaminopimelate ligase [Sphingobacteriaceae bacterium]